MKSLKKSVTLLLMGCFCTLMGQNHAELATMKFNDALLFMNNGEMFRGRSLLVEAILMDVREGHYSYDLALSYYVEEDFRTAVGILENRISNENGAAVEFYLLLGSCHLLQGNTEGAATAYEAGLKRYPDSGVLFLEQGNLQRGIGHIAKALSSYEKGIEADPDFALNYFRAAQLCMGMEKYARAMVYAETFINLEPEDQRSATAARLLQEVYGRYLQGNGERYYGGKVSFEKLVAIDLGNSARKAQHLDLESLSRIRTAFIRGYYGQGHDTMAPEPLLDYQKKALDAGHMEAYNYWLLSPLDPEAFRAWKSGHAQEWASFEEWIGREQLARPR